MDVINAILTRRSIRKYTDESVSDEDTRTLLKCAMLAPSAQNEQPWEFVVVKDALKRQSLSRLTPYTGMAARAPLVIMVCGDTRLQKSQGFWIQDCAASIQNILLAARGLDLGAVWCGIYPVEERVTQARALLNIPDHVQPVGMICIGHPAHQSKEEDRFRPERVHYELW